MMTYRQAVREAMRGYDTSALEKQLAKAGYARHVIPDEVQAYIVAPSGELGAASRRSCRYAKNYARCSGSMRRGCRCPLLK